jgi:hypothetical protein
LPLLKEQATYHLHSGQNNSSFPNPKLPIRSWSHEVSILTRVTPTASGTGTGLSASTCVFPCQTSFNQCSVLPGYCASPLVTVLIRASVYLHVMNKKDNMAGERQLYFASRFAHLLVFGPALRSDVFSSSRPLYVKTIHSELSNKVLKTFSNLHYDCLYLYSYNYSVLIKHQRKQADHHEQEDK